MPIADRAGAGNKGKQPWKPTAGKKQPTEPLAKKERPPPERKEMSPPPPPKPKRDVSPQEDLANRPKWDHRTRIVYGEPEEMLGATGTLRIPRGDAPGTDGPSGTSIPGIGSI